MSGLVDQSGEMRVVGGLDLTVLVRYGRSTNLQVLVPKQYCRITCATVLVPTYKYLLVVLVCMFPDDDCEDAKRVVEGKKSL